MMTVEQGQRLRVLLQEAFSVVLGKPITFVLVMHDEEQHLLDMVSNESNRETLAGLLKAASVIVRSPPDATIKIPDHRGAGESADASAPGMECSHAAPQDAAPVEAPILSANPGPALEGAAADKPHPAGAALPPHGEECAVKAEDGSNCPNPPAAGLRVNIYATPAIQKRYGRRVMLSLIFDLPVCQACFPRITPDNLMTGDQWRAFSKVAQQRCNGILADRGQTEIVLCQFEDPEYVALRRQIEQQRAANA